jgi:predicted LPLAT superfamily acyltransferase
VTPARHPAGARPPAAASGPAAAGWTTDAERSSLPALRLMRWFAMTAGRPRARLILHPITLYFLLANRRARRASRDFLGRALGRPAGWRDLYRHIHRFAATVLDRVYFLQGQFEHFDIQAVGSDAIRVPMEAGQGAMLMGAHLGSFESLRAHAQGRGARIAMLMFEDNARLINATLAAVAPQAQLHTIPLGRPGAMLALRDWLAGGGLAGLLADRTLPRQSGRSHTLVIDFLGRPAHFFDGPFRLAALLRQPVVFMAGLYHGGSRYELRFVQLADFRATVVPAEGGLDAQIQAAVRAYAAQLEALCRESPYNWFNFFDFWAFDAATAVTAAPDSPPAG